MSQRYTLYIILIYAKLFIEEMLILLVLKIVASRTHREYG